MNEKLKFCVDCARYRIEGRVPLCVEELPETNLITGERKLLFEYCASMRDPRGACGLEGKMWVRRKLKKASKK